MLVGKLEVVYLSYLICTGSRSALLLLTLPYLLHVPSTCVHLHTVQYTCVIHVRQNNVGHCELQKSTNEQKAAGGNFDRSRLHVVSLAATGRVAMRERCMMTRTAAARETRFHDKNRG